LTKLVVKVSHQIRNTPRNRYGVNTFLPINILELMKSYLTYFFLRNIINM
jgi:hypothetical protein